MKWPGAAAKSRDSTTDALATVLPVLVVDAPGLPSGELLRRALRAYRLPPTTRQREQPAEVTSALRWLERVSLPLAAVAEAGIIRAALDALGLRLDGRPAAASTVRRKRSVFYNLLQYAVELELLEFNPVDKLRVRSNRARKVSDDVDRRVVANSRQVRELLTAVTYVGERGTRSRGVRLRALLLLPLLRGAATRGSARAPGGRLSSTG